MTLPRPLLQDLLFVSFFLIFFSFIPIGIETQPIFSVIISFIFIFSAPINERCKKDVAFTYLFIFILLLYVTWQVLYTKTILTPVVEFFKYLIGPIIFLAIRSTNYSIRYRVIKLVVYFISGVAVLNLVFPSAYDLLFRFLIPRFSGNQVGGVRGINILTPEPSYFSIFQIILLATIEKQIGDENSGEMKGGLLKLKYIVIVLSLFTKSALVILLSLIFLIPNFKNIKLKKVFLALFIIIPITGVLIFFFYRENRFFEVIALVYDLLQDNSFDLSYFLINQEASGGTRIIVNFLAIGSLFINPFGGGLGSFSALMQSYALFYNIDLTNHELLNPFTENKVYPSTYFASLCNDIGILAFLLFPIILINRQKKDKAFSIKISLLLLVTMFFQSQLTSPAFWYIIAISKFDNDEKIIR